MSKTTIEEYDENGKLIKKTIIETNDENIPWWGQNIPYYFNSPWNNNTIVTSNPDLSKYSKDTIN